MTIEQFIEPSLDVDPVLSDDPDFADTSTRPQLATITVAHSDIADTSTPPQLAIKAVAHSDVADTSTRPQSPAVARLEDDAPDASVDANEPNKETQSTVGKVDTTVSPEFRALSDSEDDDEYKQEYTESDLSDHNLSDIDGESELDGLKAESSSAVKFGVALRPRNFDNKLLFQAREPCPLPYVPREKGGIVSVQLYCIYKFIHLFT